MKNLILLICILSAFTVHAQPKLVGTVHYNGAKYGGSIFRINLPGTGPGAIYNFDNTTPHYPLYGVVADNNGWLYGSLNYNGTNSMGCFYKINQDGTGYTKLFNYAGYGAGVPFFHTDEMLYVMGGNDLKKFDPTLNTVSTLTSSVYGRNLFIDANDWIYFEGSSSLSKIKTDGSLETPLHNFIYPTEGFEPIGVTEVSSTTLFGIQRWGGANDGGCIYKIDKDGNNFSIVHHFSNTTGVGPLSKLVLIDGKLYGTTTSGGSFGFGTMYSINDDGTNFRVLYNFTGGNGTAVPIGNIAISSNGRVFGTFSSFVWDGSNYNRLFKIDTSGQNYESFFSLDQRRAGDFPQDILLLNDKDVFGVTSEYGRHNGGVLFRSDSTGSGSDLFHFGASANGFRPTGGVIKGSTGKLYGTTVYGGTSGNGIIFSVNDDGTAYTKLHEFTDAEGYEPIGKLLEASDGKLYGACKNGLNSAGILFRIDKNGANYQTILRFDGSFDGNAPTGSLVEDASGALYGTTFYGNNVGGTVFKVNKNGTGHTLLRSFDFSTTDLLYPYNGLRLYKGYLYGAGGYGGAEGKGGVYRIKTDGSNYQVLHEFTAATGGELPVGTPYLASNGKLYGTTAFGGTNSEGTLYRVDTTGANFTIIRNFASSTDGAYPWASLIQASDGLMYGVTQTSSITSTGGTVFKFNLDGTGFTVIRELNDATEGQGIMSLIDLNGNFSLPVQWVKFTATKKGMTSLLEWQTANEQNNNHFDIERSADGLIFEKIGSIAATNNANGTSYSFNDDHTLTGVNYYRLKQIDFDNKYEYSRVVQLNFNSKNIFTVFPNPVQDVLNIRLNSGEALVSASITDLSGRVIKQIQRSNAANLSINVKSLESGVYIIHLETVSGKYTQRFVKQ